MLNGLMATLGPAMIAKFAGGAPNSPLASLLQSGSVTPAQAASVSPADVEALTTHAQTSRPVDHRPRQRRICPASSAYQEPGRGCFDDCDEENRGLARRIIFPSIKVFGCKSPAVKEGTNVMADLDQLKQKYSPVIQTIEGFSDLGAKLDSVSLDGDKLYLKGSVPSEVVANRVWDVIKQVDPQYADLHHEIITNGGAKPKLHRQEWGHPLQNKQPLLWVAQPLLEHCRREQHLRSEQDSGWPANHRSCDLVSRSRRRLCVLFPSEDTQPARSLAQTSDSLMPQKFPPALLRFNF